MFVFSTKTFLFRHETWCLHLKLNHLRVQLCLINQGLVRDSQASEHTEILIPAFLLLLPLSLNGPPFQNRHLDVERCKQRDSLVAGCFIFLLMNTTFLHFRLNRQCTSEIHPVNPWNYKNTSWIHTTCANYCENLGLCITILWKCLMKLY